MTPPVDKRSTIIAWSLIGIGLVTASLLVPMPVEGRVPEAIGNMVHGPLFAALTAVTVGQSNRWFPRSIGRFSLTRTIAIGIAWFCFGVAIEFAQALSGRSSSIVDVVSNGLGITAGCCFIAAQFRRIHHPSDRRTPRLLWGFAGFLIAVVWWQPIATLRDVVAMKRDFPLLASFESATELERWYFQQSQPERSLRDATHGRHSLQVTFAVGDHPSATLVEFPHDWSDVRSIEVDVTLDSNHKKSSAEVWIKAIDSPAKEDFSDSFRKRFTLQRGETSHLVVSRDELRSAGNGRLLDLSQIRFIELQMLGPPVPTTIRFDFLRLKL